jgi:hypothetical protein
VAEIDDFNELEFGKEWLDVVEGVPGFHFTFPEAEVLEWMRKAGDAAIVQRPSERILGTSTKQKKEQ